MKTSEVISIAVIDDDESICRSLSRLLRQSGFEPISFPSAEDFLAEFTNRAFGCLLVDVQLGGMSGIDLRHRLTALGDTTPIIFITAHDDPAARKAALDSGCSGFFRKTDPGSTILETIRRVAPGAEQRDHGR
jgi:FixJ family two-component response regulator